MKVYKIMTKREYKDKKTWCEIGTAFENDKQQISGFLNNNPDVQVYLFEQKPKEQNQPPNAREQFNTGDSQTVPF